MFFHLVRKMCLIDTPNYRISLGNLPCSKVGPSILSEYESCMTAITGKEVLYGRSAMWW